MTDNQNSDKDGTGHAEKSDRLTEILAILYVTIIIIILFLEIMFG